MDSFKVVYITELDEIEPVPHQWEVNGTVFWPLSKREARLMQSDVKSIPNKDTWKQYKDCQVKAEGILLFAHAASTADQLCSIENTDEEQELISSRRLVKAPDRYEGYESFFNIIEKTPTKKEVPAKNKKSLYSSLAYSSSESNTSSVGQFGHENIKSDQSKIYKETVQLNSFSGSSSQGSSHKIIFDNSDATVVPNIDISEIDIQKEFKAMLEKIESFQTYVEKELASIMVMLTRVEKNQLQNLPIHDDDLKESTIFPINTIEDVKDFEHKLNDEEYKRKINAYLRSIIGTGSKWRQAAYKLCDTMFTKKLLTMYSWTGVSRSENKKQSFNGLVNIIDVFYHVVYSSDNCFTHALKEQFFRDAVLKHSQSRLTPKKRILPAKIQQSSEQQDKNAELDENASNN